MLADTVKGHVKNWGKAEAFLVRREQAIYAQTKRRWEAINPNASGEICNLASKRRFNCGRRSVRGTVQGITATCAGPVCTSPPPPLRNLYR